MIVLFITPALVIITWLQHLTIFPPLPSLFRTVLEAWPWKMSTSLFSDRFASSLLYWWPCPGHNDCKFVLRSLCSITLILVSLTWSEILFVYSLPPLLSHSCSDCSILTVMPRAYPPLTSLHHSGTSDPVLAASPTSFFPVCTTLLLLLCYTSVNQGEATGL